MEWEDIFKIIAAILASLGGGGSIILMLSKYLGNIFAKRYEEKIKTNFQHEINEYKSQLDIIKQTTLRYSDKQFELYNTLWSNLHDLKVLADDLWIKASPNTLGKFSKQLVKTKKEVERASLFIEEEHYENLVDILKQFAEYQIGKSELINMRFSNNHNSNSEILQMIEQNGHLKSEYETLISIIKNDLRSQIKGHCLLTNT